MTKMVKQDEMKKGDGVKNSDEDKKGRNYYMKPEFQHILFFAVIQFFNLYST